MLSASCLLAIVISFLLSCGACCLPLPWKLNSSVYTVVILVYSPGGHVGPSWSQKVLVCIMVLVCIINALYYIMYIWTWEVHSNPSSLVASLYLSLVLPLSSPELPAHSWLPFSSTCLPGRGLQLAPTLVGLTISSIAANSYTCAQVSHLLCPCHRS